MLFKVYVALLAVCANALPEAYPQGAQGTTTATRTVTSTKPAVTNTKTITTCTLRPSTTTATRTSTVTTTRGAITTTRTVSSTTTVRGAPVTVTKPITVTKSASTITKTANPITKTTTVTPTPSASKPPAYLQVITHPDPLCGTKPVDQQYQNPRDDQITVPVASGGSVCRSFSNGIGSFSFLRLNADSFAAGCRVYYYSEQTCQSPINDGTALSNENKCINIPQGKMFSFQVLCGV